MHKEDCFYLGKIVKKHSFKGEVVIKLDTDEPELYQNLESVFIDLGGNLIPFFIQKSSLTKDVMLRVKFEDVSTEEDADAIVRSDIYLPLSMLPKLDDDKFYYHEVVGYEVVDVKLGFIGILKNINDNSAQELLEIENEDRQIFIPMVEEFVEKVDKINKKFVVNTPKGLIDMFF